MSEDAGSGVKVDGLDEFRKELRRAADGKTLRKEFTAEERKIAQRVAQAARAQASGGPQRHFASKITGKVSPRKGALVGIAPVANAAFWGAKKNTGWNRAAREGSKAQHPAWVGAAWVVDLGLQRVGLLPQVHGAKFGLVEFDVRFVGFRLNRADGVVPHRFRASADCGDRRAGNRRVLVIDQLVDRSRRLHVAFRHP
ncbi:MAG TPA: hypothetical protein PLV92_27410, partial [Pirellulaceae bacterium]|nr:hypothetical protein [Pirellulaceae bacterium]